jgi:hypothetical protein
MHTWPTRKGTTRPGGLWLSRDRPGPVLVVLVHWHTQKLRPTGFEQGFVSDTDASHLRQSAKSSAAKSGASSDGSTLCDRELAEVIESWPALPDPIKAGVIALIRAARPPGS